jgi:glycosyltransferase involved in cell wall biosynthesis
VNTAESGISVLFDGYWMVDGPPSGRNVLQSLVRNWADAFPGDDVTVALPSFADFSDAQLSKAFGERVRTTIVRAPIRNHGAWTTLALRNIVRQYDVVLTQNFAPLFVRGPATVAVFLHDALFVEHPNWFTRLERLYLGAIRPTLRFADVVLTSSKAESARISAVWPRVGRKTFPIGLGVPHGLTVAESKKPSMSRIGDRPFILSVGRLNVRKNIANMIAAYQSDEGIASGYDLVIVGASDGKYNAVLQSDRENAVIFTGHVSDEELSWLYSHAELFIFPSLDEGFGLPLLEARMFGTASVASDIPPFREIGGSAAYFDPTSISSIARAVRLGLSSDRTRSTIATTPADSEHDWGKVVRAARMRTTTFMRDGRGKTT